MGNDMATRKTTTRKKTAAKTALRPVSRRNAVLRTRPEDLETIGERILWARMQQGMDQDELSSLVHVTTRSVSDWENNKVIPHKWARSLAEVLNVSQGWIMYGEEASLNVGEVRPLLEEILRELQNLKKSIPPQRKTTRR